MKNIFCILFYFFNVIFLKQAYGNELYNCNRICGFCENDNCCRPWNGGYIKSTKNAKIYQWENEQNRKNISKTELNNYFFYKVKKHSNWNVEKYDEFITKIKNVEEQQTLVINREKGIASFNEGSDYIIECILK